MTLLKRTRPAILPAAALAAAGVTIWLDTLDSIDVNRDDLLPAVLTIVLSLWALIDYYYRKLTRDRQQAHAGHDVGVLAEGVAAYMRQAPAWDGKHVPGPRADS